MSENDPGALADHLEQEADKLDEHSERLEGEVQDVRQDWQQKRSDPSVPGAPPPASDEGQPEEAEYPAKDQDSD